MIKVKTTALLILPVIALLFSCGQPNEYMKSDYVQKNSGDGDVTADFSLVETINSYSDAGISYADTLISYTPPEVTGGEGGTIHVPAGLEYTIEDTFRKHINYNWDVIRHYFVNQSVTPAILYANGNSLFNQAIIDMLNWSANANDIVHDSLKTYLLHNPYLGNDIITPTLSEMPESWTPDGGSALDCFARIYYYYASSEQTLVEPANAATYNMVHDLGRISPVVTKIKETANETTYAVWYTKISKTFKKEGLWRDYTYKYRPACATLTKTGNSWNWSDNSTSYLNGFGDLLDKNMIVVDVKKKENYSYYVLWYLYKEGPINADDKMDLNSDEWRLYSAHTFDWTFTDRWQVLENGFQSLSLDVGASGFDTKAINNAGVVYDFENNDFKIWYSGKNSYNSEIGTASSASGFGAWSKSSTKSAVKVRERLFDNINITDPTIMATQTSQGILNRIWYAGQDENGNWKVGLLYNFDRFPSEYSYFHPTEYLPIGGTDNVRFPFVLPINNTGDFILLYSRQVDRAGGTNDDLPEDSDNKIWKIEMTSGQITQ